MLYAGCKLDKEVKKFNLDQYVVDFWVFKVWYIKNYLRYRHFFSGIDIFHMELFWSWLNDFEILADRPTNYTSTSSAVMNIGFCENR